MILLNDGSTDATPSLIESLCRRDPRIKGVHLHHEGISRTLNTGLSMATGEFIARMDADDISHPGRLSQQHAFLRQRPEICAVGCQVRLFPRPGQPTGMLAYEEWSNSLITSEDIAKEIFVESPLVHPSVLVRKESLKAVGGYGDQGPEDYDLWLRMHLEGMRFGKVAKTLLWWRDRPDRATRASPDYSRQAFRRCKARHLARLLGSDKPILLAGNREAKRLAPLLSREGLRIDAYVDINPTRVGTCHRGIPVLGYEDLSESYQGRMLLVAVGSRGARCQIRERLVTMGLKEGKQFLCVA